MIPSAEENDRVRILKRVLGLFGILVLLIGANSLFARLREKVRSEPASINPPVDTQKSRIEEVLTNQVIAWNRGDLTGFMQAYSNRPEPTFYSGGTIIVGKGAILERYRQRYQAEGREMGRLDFRDLIIDELGTDQALVRGRWRLRYAWYHEQNGLFTLLMRREPTGWVIVHDHTSSAD